MGGFKGVMTPLISGLLFVVGMLALIVWSARLEQRIEVLEHRVQVLSAAVDGLGAAAHESKPASH